MKRSYKTPTIFSILILLLIAGNLFAGNPNIISMTMIPPAPNFGDRITVQIVYCGQLYMPHDLGLSISTKPAPTNAMLTGNGQVFIVSRAGMNTHTTSPALTAGGKIGYMAHPVSTTWTVQNCSTCGSVNNDGNRITVTYGDDEVLTVPEATNYPGCNNQQLYLHAVMKDGDLFEGEYVNPPACQLESLTWTIPTLSTQYKMLKRAEGVLQTTGDLILFSMDYEYAQGQLTINDTIPVIPGVTSITLVSSGPQAFYSGPAGGTVVTPGTPMSWTLPNKVAPAYRGMNTGTVWFLLRITGNPTMGQSVNNTAYATMTGPGGTYSGSAFAGTIAGQPAITIRKYQSIDTAAVGDIVTYALEYAINGNQLVVYQSFDEFPLASPMASAPPGWSFRPSASNGNWYVEDPCGTGDRILRGDTTLNNDYPGLLYTGNPMASVLDCSNMIVTDVLIDPQGETTGSGYEGADALVVIRDDGQSVSGKGYGLVLSVDDFIGTNNNGNIGFQRCGGTACRTTNCATAQTNPITTYCDWPNSVNTMPIAANKWYRVKVETAYNNNPCSFRARVWAKGDPEPNLWTISWTDANCTADGFTCNGAKTWYAGVAEQGGATAFTQDSYNNFIMYKPRTSADTMLYDTIPTAISHLGHTGSATISNGMIQWFLGAISDQDFGSFTWWGSIDSCGPITNIGAIDGADPIIPVLSNPVVITMYCGTPTVTPTSTPTSTYTATRTITATATPTSTRTDTPTVTVTNTYTSTRTDTPTRTNTPTSTETYTKTATPTVTDTSTMTSTPTDTRTKTDTPTATDTRTMTPTYTETNTKTATRTFTETSTMTATPTVTDTISSNTPTVTRTFTATPTVTLTNTQTATATDTKTVTATPTFTNTLSSDTPTATPTFTITHTATPTHTVTYTRTATPTFTNTATNTPLSTLTATPTITLTNTPTSTPTSTPTNTRTASPTPTYTATLTITETSTITPTPELFPYLVNVKIYNEAGEVIKTLGSVFVKRVMTDVLLSVNGEKTKQLILGEGKFEIYLPGLETAGNLGTGGTSYEWGGENDQSQFIMSGVYYLQVEQIDPYGHVYTITKDLSVMDGREYVELNIYNSAGEIVRRQRQYGANYSGYALNIDMPDLIVINAGDTGNVDIKFTNNPGDVLNWDGKTGDGKIVSNGVYEIQVIVRDDIRGTAAVAKSVTVIRASEKFLGSLSIVPNPYTGQNEGSGGVEIRWDFGADTWQQNYPLAVPGTVRVMILNISGGLVRELFGDLKAGTIKWDTKTPLAYKAADGVYIVVVEAKNQAGYVERKTQKLAIIRGSN